MQSDSELRPKADSDHLLPSATEPEKPHRGGLKVLAWIAVLCFFAAGFYLVLRQHQASQAAAPTGRRGGAGGGVTLTSTTAQNGNIGVYVSGLGTVVPVYTSNITSQVSGIVTEVHYAEGQMVRKGDPLIEIDPRAYQATLQQAQGVLQRDQGLLAQAQMDLSRYQAAWARNAIQKQTLDDQEKLVEQDQGTVENDKGTVQYDQVQLGFCHIVSPITGRVGLRLVDPGNVVQANGGTVLAVVAQIQPITVVFTVAEDSLGQVLPHLRKGPKLRADAYDHNDAKLITSGTLLTLDNQVDTTTGTVKARAQFKNADSALFPNQFVNVHLLVNTLTGVTLIPTGAVQHNQQTTFVYVLQDGKAHVRNITVGVTDGDTNQVQGINPGDVVATSGFDKLQDNTPVTIDNRSVQGGGGGRASGTGGATGGAGTHTHGKAQSGSNPSAGSNTH